MSSPLVGRRAVLGGGVALLGGCGARPARAQQPALRRGVCLSSWFSNAPRQPLRERDFAQIARVGFDHVRVQVNPEQIGYKSAPSPTSPRPDPAQARWGEVDEAVALAIRHGLAAVFDVHPEPAFHARLERQDWVADDLVAFVRHAAERYRGHPPDRFAFEVLNEPQFYKAADAYRRLALRLVGAARDGLPGHALLVGGPFGGSVQGLRAMEPFDDPNMIYTAHFYLPYIVTHQGINAGFERSEVRAFRGVPYPASLVDPAADYAPGAKNRLRAWAELLRYRAEDWGPERVLHTLQPAAAWAEAHGARVVCTEFGAYRPYIDPASRYRWIGDVRRALERLGIGWTVFDYADVFGITTPVGETATDPGDQAVRLLDPERGVREFEPEALAALGLEEP